MITKVCLKVKGQEEQVFMAEIEQTQKGYKFIMPDGSGMEIYRDFIEKIEVEQETYTGVQSLGNIQQTKLNTVAPRYKEYEYGRERRMR